MIRITVDMWPGGDDRYAYRLASFDIANVGGTEDRGDYDATFYNKSGGQLRRTASIRGWARLSRPVLSLIRRILGDAGY